MAPGPRRKVRANVENRPAVGYLRKQVVPDGVVWRLAIGKTNVLTGELIIRRTNDGDLFVSLRGNGDTPLTED